MEASTRRNAIDRYLKGYQNEPFYSDRKLGSMIEQYRDVEDISALESIVMSHRLLVVKIASRFPSARLPMEDILSNGTLGLILAVQNIPESRYRNFRPFAQQMIRNEIVKGFSDTAYTIRMNRRLLREYADKGEQMYLDPNLSKKKIEQKMIVYHMIKDGHIQITRPDGPFDSEITLEDTLVDDVPGIDESLEYVSPKKMVVDLLEEYLADERMGIETEQKKKDVFIVRQYYLNTEKIVTCKDLAKQLGCGTKSVDYHKSKALRHLRLFAMEHGYGELFFKQ
ncbi:MAG: sigma factor [archaeon]